MVAVIGSFAEGSCTNWPLYRAYLLKEQLRQVFQLPLPDALTLLQEWLDWASRCHLQPFVELAERIANHIEPIINVLAHRLSNARLEALNTRIRLIARRAFGFHSPDALIALAMLSLGGFTPALPQRQP
jgi:transposase